MVNVNKLRGKMVEKNVSVTDMANDMNVDKSTVYRKLNNPDEITVGEIRKMVGLLGLDAAEINSIFFA